MFAVLITEVKPQSERTEPKQLNTSNYQKETTNKNYLKKTISKVKTKDEKLGQVTKSVGRMPWHLEPMKDAVSCEKLRRAANKPRPVDIRMWKHAMTNSLHHILNKIDI